MSDYDNLIISDEPVAYWKMANTSGIIASDDIGDNDLTYKPNSSGTWSGGTLSDTALMPGSDGAAKFNGTSGYAITEASDTFDITGDLTLECWIKINSVPDNLDTIIAKGFDGTNNQYYIDFRKSGSDVKIQFGTFRSPSTGAQVLSSTVVETDSVYHIVGVRDDTNDTYKIYINGVEDNSASSSQSLFQSSRHMFSVGMLDLNGTPSRFAPITVSNIAIYDKVLSSERISLHHRYGSEAIGAGYAGVYLYDSYLYMVTRSGNKVTRIDTADSSRRKSLDLNAAHAGLTGVSGGFIKDKYLYIISESDGRCARVDLANFRDVETVSDIVGYENAVELDIYANLSSVDISHLFVSITLGDIASGSTGNQQISLEFRNYGPGSITAIVFESGMSALLDVSNTDTSGHSVSGTGTNMIRNGSYSLHQGSAISWAGNDLAITASTASDGIDTVTDLITVSADVVGGITASDLLTVLGTSGTRIAVVVTDYESSTVGLVSAGKLASTEYRGGFAFGNFGYLVPHTDTGLVRLQLIGGQ